MPVTDPPRRAQPLLLSVYPSFAVGGAQVRFAAVANHFGQRYRHAVVAMDHDIAAGALLAPDLDVEFVDPGHVKGATFGNLRLFRRALRRHRPHALLTTNWGTIEWAMANALPLARHIHFEDGFGPEERARQIPRRVLARRLFLRRATVVAPSRGLERIARQTWRLPADHVRYLPNGIDLARFGPAADVAPFPLQGTGPVIATVAALRPEKNLARLLRVFRRVRQALPARLLIAGDGPQRHALERQAAELGIASHVTFAGALADPRPVYRAADIYAVTSDTEQMPLTVLEAMAGALPVAATDVGDVRIMLAPENGAFVTPLDDAALAEAITTLVRDRGLRAALGRANRAKAERDYDQRAMFRAYAELLDGP